VTTPQVSARRIGNERQPVVTIDHFAPDPHSLRDFAIASQFEPAEHNYPGIRASLPKSYFADIGPALLPVLAEVFGCHQRLRILDASFSIVTDAPGALTVEQRIPHVDAYEPGRIALVHYLSLTDRDGTAFYQHRATGYETIDVARAPAYYETLANEFATAPPPAAYIIGDTAQFRCVARLEAAFNRALIYRSGILHSGAISPDAVLSSDPALGRLTVTAFFDAG
jgi:Family of unknown function (DUF6445)